MNGPVDRVRGCLLIGHVLSKRTGLVPFFGRRGGRSLLVSVRATNICGKNGSGQNRGLTRARRSQLRKHASNSSTFSALYVNYRGFPRARVGLFIASTL